MPANSAVRGCGSNYRHKLPGISFYPFPKDGILRKKKKWKYARQKKKDQCECAADISKMTTSTSHTQNDITNAD